MTILMVSSVNAQVDFQLSLRTMNGQYVSMVSGGGGPLHATVYSVGSFESPVAQDLNGGQLMHGDLITLRSPITGHYVSARADKSGIPLEANVPWGSVWEKFQVVREAGPGQVRSGDAAFLRAFNGKFVTCRYDWPGNPLAASASWMSNWERLRFVVCAPGFAIHRWANGVRTYIKPQSRTSHFMTVVDLARASLKSLATDPSGEQPKQLKFHLTQWFVDEGKRKQTPAAPLFAVLNGTFFDDNFPPFTRISYGLKYEGFQVQGVLDWPSARLLSFGGPSANIAANPWAAILDPGTTNIVTGVSIDTNTGTEVKGRTVIGLFDLNGDGLQETLLIYSSKFATKEQAIGSLLEFGARDLMQLDSGPSSFLYVQNQVLVSMDRRVIPHGIGIYSGY